MLWFLNLTQGDKFELEDGSLARDLIVRNQDGIPAGGDLVVVPSYVTALYVMCPCFGGCVMCAADNPFDELKVLMMPFKTLMLQNDSKWVRRAGRAGDNAFDKNRVSPHHPSDPSYIQPHLPASASHQC